MKQDWKPDELRATSAEIREAVMPKSITPEMVGGTLAGLTEAVAEVVETLGEIPREHVRVKCRALDQDQTFEAVQAKVCVDIFTTKGYPAVSLPRKELIADKNGEVEFDVPHGFHYAVFSKYGSLSASFQWVHLAATESRLVELWNVPIGIWYYGAIFHSNEETGDTRPTPFVVGHYTSNLGDEVEQIASQDLREGESYMDYYTYGICVATEDTCFIIPPESKSAERMAWSNSRAYGMYIPGMEHINNHTEEGRYAGDFAEAQNRARSDYNGNMNTAKILGAVNGATAAEWVGATVYDYSENRWLPSAGQAYLMHLNRKAINTLMQEAIDVDGLAFVLLPDYKPGSTSQWTHYEYWWTSSVFDDYCSWVVNYGGNIRSYTRNRSNDVRAVSAFHFEY